jgi:hypothetical protein
VAYFQIAAITGRAVPAVPNMPYAVLAYSAYQLFVGWQQQDRRGRIRKRIRLKCKIW